MADRRDSNEVQEEDFVKDSDNESDNDQNPEEDGQEQEETEFQDENHNNGGVGDDDGDGQSDDQEQEETKYQDENHNDGSVDDDDGDGKGKADTLEEEKDKQEEEEKEGEDEANIYSFPRAGSKESIKIPPQEVYEPSDISDVPDNNYIDDTTEVPGVYPVPDVLAEVTSGDESHVDAFNSPNLPDLPEDRNRYPSSSEVDQLLGYGQEDDDAGDLLAFQDTAQDDADVTELVVLDPDHPLMSNFQKALNEYFKKQLEKVTLQLREAMHTSKVKEQQRENIGVELYGVQQDLARSQMQLEKLRDESETVKRGRELAEQELSEMRTSYREKQAQASTEHRNNADLQTQVENLNLRLFYMENTKDNVRADIAVMKRAAEKAEADVLRAEESKRIQDLFVDRLTEKLTKLQEDLALCTAQLAAQAEETRATKAAVMEARMEIEAITIEKKQLFQQWNSSLIGMKRRDEAHAAMLRALHLQEQQVLTLDCELNGLKKDIQSEQENNEKLTLILKKCEDEMNRVRNNLSQCLARQEEIKNDSSQYMSILKQTEDALNIALLEKNRLMKHLNDLRVQIEHAFREKVKIEEEILETMRSQLISDKAAQNTHRLIQKKRDEMKDLESKTAVTENDISKLLFEITHLQTNSDGLKKTLTQLTEEYDQKNKIISQSEYEINQRRNKIKNKKGELDLLNKKLSQLKEKAGGVEVSPLQVEINSLQKSIDCEQQQIAELQHNWLKDQSELVRLCKEEETMSESVETHKRELTVLTQKKLRVEGEITRQRREITEVEKKIHDIQNHMVRLNTLIHRETGTEDTLANDNVLRENEFMYALKDAEKNSIKMQEQLEALKEEKERLLNSLVEAERQIMLWEKKTQLARETRAAVDMDVGQGEIHAMRMEIHRMQVRESQLKREQEKLVQDLEKTVSRRDIITTRGEALAKTKMNFVTKGSLERQVTDLKRRMKQLKQDINDIEFEEKELKEQQEQTSLEIDQHQVILQQQQYESETLENEVDRLIEQKQKNLADIISKQQRSKFYQQLKEGKYNRICKNKSTFDAEYQKETEHMNNLIAIVDTLKQKFPYAQPSLQKVVFAYGSRPDAS